MKRVLRNMFNNVRMAPPRTEAASVLGADGRYIVRSPFPNVDIPNTPAVELLWQNVDRWPNKVAIECAETRKKYTYHQLLTNVQRFGSSLIDKLGLRKGDVVSVVLPNMPEFAVAALGGVQAGITVSTVNPIYTEFEFHHMFSITRPKVVVTIEECHGAVTAALTKLNHHAKIVVVDRNNETIPSGAVRFSEMAESGDPNLRTLTNVQRNMDDLLFLPFSSGTTGMPKAVQISQKNIIAGLQIIGSEYISLPNAATADFQEVVPCLLPFFHIYGLIILMLGHLREGCKLVTMTKFNAQLFMDVLIKDRATLLYVVPPLAIFLGKADAVTPEHLASVRYTLSGAAPLSADDIQVLLQKSPNMEVIQGYGATETTSVCTTMAKGSVKDYSGVGFAMSNTEVRLVCPVTGQVLPPDQVGELQIRGPQVCPGYYKNEEANRSSFTPDGFYCSGDLASFNQDGSLQIKDRLKELIKVKGLQVAPAELEGILRTHPAVLEAAVVGIPHEINGEVPRAFVVPRSTENPPGVQELLDFVASRVASFKKIHRLQYVKEIPKTNTGKILRRKLLEMYE